MILYACPACKSSGLFSEELHGAVNCRSCGKPFVLSPFTRADPPIVIRITRSIHSVIARGRGSRFVIYGAAALALSLIAWAAMSMLNFIPDEARIINRRFATPEDWTRMEKAVAIIAVGSPTANGSINFWRSGTAWAITNDGFMITCRHVIAPFVPDSDRVWVYFDRRRVDAEIVYVDPVADFAVIKADTYIPYKLRIADQGWPRTLNENFVAVGFPTMSDPVPSPVLDTKLAVTNGSLARFFQDDAGTWILEHTALTRSGGSGGPLFRGPYVVGINARYVDGIFQALDITEYRTKIFNAIADWTKHPGNGDKK